MSNPQERVRQALSESGLSHGEFAQQVGLDASKLSKSLSGVRRFSSLDLARIGDLTGRSVDWLLGGDEPPLASAARAAHGSPLGAATSAAYELVAIRRGLAELGFPQLWSPPEVPRLTGLDHVQGARLAEIALGHMADHDRSVLDDLAGGIESAFGVDVAITPLANGVDGLAVASDQVHLILAAPSAIPYRQRFTIAHELGHLLAGDDQELHLDQDIFGTESKTTHSERRANAFVGAFLMPEPLLRERVAASGRLDEEAFCRLVILLRVSPSALAYRLHSLDLIDGMALARYKAISAKKAAKVAGADRDLVAHTTQSSTPRPPGLLTADAFAAYQAGLTTLRPYARLLGEPDTERLRVELEGPDEKPRTRRRPSMGEMRSVLDDMTPSMS